MTVKFNRKMLLALLIFVFLLSIVIVSLILKSENKKQTVDLEYRVVFENIDESFKEKIKEGDTVYNARTMSKLGEVVSVNNTERYFVYEYDGVEDITKKEFPNRYNIELVIRNRAEFIEGVGCNIDGIRIAVGRELELRFPDFVGRSYCRDIRLGEQYE